LFSWKKMVIIRLTRIGTKKRPFYKIVVADKRMPRDGRFIEKVGYYNPCIKKNTMIYLNLERMSYWINTGAKTTNIVASLVKKNSIIY